MTSVHRVFLVPGFFGFAELGALPYFAHAAEFLTDVFRARGLEVQIMRTPSRPTASIAVRAQELRETIVTSDGDGPIHLVGHSSGGLDARWLAHEDRQEPWTQRLVSVCCLSTPHHGTPLARLFTGLFGHRLLELVSLATVYTLRFGRLPIGVGAKLLGLFVRADDILRFNRTILDQLHDQLLADFSAERRDQLSDFFTNVRKDTALIPELIPGRIPYRQLLDHPNVRYGSVVTEGAAPGLRTAWRAGLDPYAQTTHGIYAALHALSTKYLGAARPVLQSAHRPGLIKAFGRCPDHSASDGVVPTLSQLHGELIHGAHGDHLDVIGHFHDPDHYPAHYDWLSSGSGFRRPAFERLWSDVGAFMLSDHDG